MSDRLGRPARGIDIIDIAVVGGNFGSSHV
jgi:hypothetical protein